MEEVVEPETKRGRGACPHFCFRLLILGGCDKNRQTHRQNRRAQDEQPEQKLAAQATRFPVIGLEAEQKVMNGPSSLHGVSLQTKGNPSPLRSVLVRIILIAFRVSRTKSGFFRPHEIARDK
jgi:hypothetical protein